MTEQVPCASEDAAPSICLPYLARAVASPSHLTLGRLQRVREPLRGFRHELKIADDGVLNRVGRVESRAASTGVSFDSTDTLQDMQEVLAIVFHRGTASLRTSSRISGLSERAMTTSTRRFRTLSRSTTRPPGNHGLVGPTMSISRSTSLSERADRKS